MPPEACVARRLVLQAPTTIAAQSRVKYARARHCNRYRALPQITTYTKDRAWIEKRNDAAA